MTIEPTTLWNQMRTNLNHNFSNNQNMRRTTNPSACDTRHTLQTDSKERFNCLYSSIEDDSSGLKQSSLHIEYQYTKNVSILAAHKELSHHQGNAINNSQLPTVADKGQKRRSSVDEYNISDHSILKNTTHSQLKHLYQPENKHYYPSLLTQCGRCLNSCKSKNLYVSETPLLSLLKKRLLPWSQSKTGSGNTLRTLLLISFLLSFLLPHSCHGYVLKNPGQELRRVKHSVDNQPLSSPSSPLPSSSLSSLSSSSPSSFLPLDSQFPRSSLSNTPTNYSKSDPTTDSKNVDTSQVSNLATTFISVLQKMHVLPVSNTSFCISLEEINPGKSIDRPDPSSDTTSHFTISLTFKITNLDKMNSENTDKNSNNSTDISNPQNNSTKDSQNTTATTTITQSQFLGPLTHDCVSDPKVLLALILDENGLLVNTLANRDTGNERGGSGPGSSKNTGTTTNPGLTIESGNLSRTQVVVIATCSAIIGFFFLSAAFLRIRNYIKRLQSEKANARRKKFRSCSFALRNSGQSSEQLRRDSLNSKASQMNSQSNVSAQEMSTPSSPRRADMDTSPYLLVTMAALDPAASVDAPQGDLYKEFGDKDKMTLPLNKSPGNSLASSRQPSPSPIGDLSQQRVSPIPSGVIQPVTKNPTRGSLYRGASISSGGAMSTSSSNPKIYTGGAPTQHPQLAKVRGVGLVRASSLGNSRDAKVAHMPQRGSLKLLRNNNRVAGKDLPPPPASNGRCVFANAFVNGGGNYMVPKNGNYDTGNNGRVPLESMKSVSFDLDRDYQSGGGSGNNCLTCNAISKRLDMICHNLKDTHCPFTMSAIHRNHQQQSSAGLQPTGTSPENMSVEATLNNAGVALSFPILAINKDVDMNSQSQAEGVVNNAFPSSTSSSPGEMSQRGLLPPPERLSASFPNSRQDLRGSREFERNGAHSASDLQNGRESTPDITQQPLQYFPSNNSYRNVQNDTADSRDQRPLNEHRQNSENNNIQNNSDRARNDVHNNCDRLHEPLINIDNSSRDENRSSVTNMKMQSPANKMSSGEELRLSITDHAKSILIENAMQDKNTEIHNQRLTRSNENVDTLRSKPHARISLENTNTNGSLPCILSPKNAPNRTQQPPTSHTTPSPQLYKGGSNESSPTSPLSPQDMYDFNDEYPLCGTSSSNKSSKPQKLALFPNRRRTLNKTFDNSECKGSAMETYPECDNNSFSMNSNSNSNSNNETTEEITGSSRLADDEALSPRPSSTDSSSSASSSSSSSRDLSSPSTDTDSGEKEGLLHGYDNSPISPPTASSSPFLPSSTSTEYIL